MKLEFYKKALIKAIETYGETSQSVMLFEEMAELQKEVCKSMRGADNYYQIMEEMADVYIMLEQLKMMYSMKDTAIQQFIDGKTERLEKRMKGEAINE